MTDNQVDPELADDREVEEVDLLPIDLPEYDPTQFELPDDYEYPGDEEVTNNGSTK